MNENNNLQLGVFRTTRPLDSSNFEIFNRIKVDTAGCLEKVPEYNHIFGFFPKEKITKSLVLKKRALIFLLKNTKNIKENEIVDIAKLLGISSEWLLSAFFILKDVVRRKENRKMHFENTRNNYFRKLYIAHERIASAKRRTRQDKLSTKIAAIKCRINKLSQTIDKISLEPSNRDIARVMNIPKGSVDSGIYYFKLYFSNNIKFKTKK